MLRAVILADDLIAAELESSPRLLDHLFVCVYCHARHETAVCQFTQSNGDINSIYAGLLDEIIEIWRDTCDRLFTNFLFLLVLFVVVANFQTQIKEKPGDSSTAELIKLAISNGIIQIRFLRRCRVKTV